MVFLLLLVRGRRMVVQIHQRTVHFLGVVHIPLVETSRREGRTCTGGTKTRNGLSVGTRCFPQCIARIWVGLPRTPLYPHPIPWDADARVACSQRHGHLSKHNRGAAGRVSRTMRPRHRHHLPIVSIRNAAELGLHIPTTMVRWCIAAKTTAYSPTASRSDTHLTQMALVKALCSDCIGSPETFRMRLANIGECRLRRIILFLIRQRCLSTHRATTRILRLTPRLGLQLIPACWQPQLFTPSHLLKPICRMMALIHPT